MIAKASLAKLLKSSTFMDRDVRRFSGKFCSFSRLFIWKVVINVVFAGIDLQAKTNEI